MRQNITPKENQLVVYKYSGTEYITRYHKETEAAPNVRIADKVVTEERWGFICKDQIYLPTTEDIALYNELVPTDAEGSLITPEIY